MPPQQPPAQLRLVAWPGAVAIAELRKIPAPS